MIRLRDFHKEVEELSKVDILRVIDALNIKITKKNKDNLIQCPSPDHADNNPSCVVFDKTIFCRSCGYKSNSFNLIKLVTGDTKVCDWAVDMGIINEHYKDGTKNTIKYKKEHEIKLIREEKKIYRESVEHHHIYEYFLSLLDDIDKDHYLVKERLLCLDVLKTNKIKAIKKDYKEELLNQFSETDLIKSGLLNISSKTNNTYFTFFNCNAVFPFFKGTKIISMQGRAKSGANKYINLGGELRAGIYIPKISIKNDIYFCEGLITALSYQSKGFDSICMIGTHVAGNESLIMSRLEYLKDRVYVLSPDYDEPGQKAIENIKRIFNKNNINYKKEEHNYRDLARNTNAKESEICSIIDFNDFVMFMEDRE